MDTKFSIILTAMIIAASAFAGHNTQCRTNGCSDVIHLQNQHQTVKNRIAQLNRERADLIRTQSHVNKRVVILKRDLDCAQNSARQIHSQIDAVECKLKEVDARIHQLKRREAELSPSRSFSRSRSFNRGGSTYRRANATCSVSSQHELTRIRAELDRLCGARDRIEDELCRLQRACKPADARVGECRRLYAAQCAIRNRVNDDIACRDRDRRSLEARCKTLTRDIEVAKRQCNDYYVAQTRRQHDQRTVRYERNDHRTVRYERPVKRCYDGDRRDVAHGIYAVASLINLFGQH